MLHPRNDYVNAFVKDAPRAKVITAATIMQPCPPGLDRSGCPTVSPDTSLEQLMPLLIDTEQPLLVINGHTQPLGYVDRVQVLQALVLAE